VLHELEYILSAKNYNAMNNTKINSFTNVHDFPVSTRIVNIHRYLMST